MRYVPALSRLALWPLLCLLAVACSNTPPPSPQLTFTRFQPMYMDVGKIDVIDEYQTTGRPPSAEQLMPMSPEDAMHIWAHDRLRAVGSVKTMQIIIHDGGVIETDVPGSGGMFSWFEGSDKRYDAKLDVEIRIYGEGAMSEASVNAVAKRSVTVEARNSIADRNAIFGQMIYGLMDDINAELEKNMFAYFGNYISFSHTP